MTDLTPSAISPLRAILGTVLVVSVLAGCTSVTPKQPRETPDFDAKAALEESRPDAVPERTQKAPVEAPQALEDDLLDFSQAPRAAKRFDVQADNVPLQRFFADLGRTEGINVLVDPSINGTISLNMRSVTIEQVMSAMRDLYGYDYQRTDYGYRVLPNQIQTRIYHLNYLNVARSGRSDTTVSGGQISRQGSEANETSSVATEYSADFWEGMETTVMGLLDEGPGRQVVVNPQSGLLVVRATPREHEVVGRFLDDAEGSLQKQVVIEAKVVEVTLNNEFRSGINWETFTEDVAQLSGNALAGVGNIGGVFSLNVDSEDFTAMLQLLSHQGDVQVLSSPRVSTVNNQKAVIKVGTDEFFVTEVTSRDESDDNGNNTSTPEFVLSPFFSGIALDVTPQISAQDNVILHVRPSVTEVVESTKVINVGNQTYNLPLALSNVRETDSIIRAASGQIVVIGGLLSQKQDTSATGLPWLSRVPGLKFLFAQNRETQSKSELVILLKPVVYDERTTLDDLDKVLNRM
ncbi:pilus (MSHA type) biogenesis protein MshL [Saccharospirillum salsuginis]|uniref:Pilus (MSHA type) biogenesis protein MshL n=1 Tax=Saccharospirillum salsuginis TaxID=418750 RepID=A0A918N824_9GAMM|nr:pilus (MSHA type) biogenesis protein MshL [Saccharospirillum salsuginis]GGX44986.1 pilus (MSHA type) biogenesis protein MshL [Saccharospirillum salsuginis]